MVFPMAPMSPLIRGLTVFTLALPLLFLGLALATPRPIDLLLGAVGAFLVAIYAFVFFWLRPRHVELTDDALVIVYPTRERAIPYTSIRGATHYTRGAFRDRFGRGMRIGAGGLWGGFGRYRTQRGGTLDLVVSREDWMVVIERAGAPSLMLTPDRPRAFVEGLAARTG